MRTYINYTLYGFVYIYIYYEYANKATPGRNIMLKIT